MQHINQHSRRNFMKISATMGGGLLLGFKVFASQELDPFTMEETVNGLVEFNAYLSVNTDGTVTIFSPNPEVGQGIKTAFPIIVAEELDIDWQRVIVKQAPLDTVKFERQVAGGSMSIPHSWKRLREAGAKARYMLMEAAAKRWGVAASECTTENGVVKHSSGKQLTYGELAAEAAKIEAPKEIKLKDRKDFKIIGKFTKGVDNQDIMTGKPLFGMDIQREGMMTAMIIHPPAFGMKLKSFDGAAAKAMVGISEVISFKNNVAIVGKSFWEVKKARDLVKVEYEKDKDATLESTADHNRIFSDLMTNGKADVKRKDGDTEGVFKTASKVVEAEYQCPFLSHAPMEPMNFFADVKDGKVELIGPTQLPQATRDQVAKLLNIPAEKITVEMTRMGGGFGRRLRPDFALEAAEISSLVKAPIKLIWTREDDMTGGTYRPAVKYRFKAALDKTGNLIGYQLRGVGINSGSTVRQDFFPSGAVDNLLLESVEHKSPITTGPWRAPITNFLAGAEQSFLDEVAEAAGKDAVTMRLDLFKKAKASLVGAKVAYDAERMAKVTELAAEKSGWFKKKKGVYLGFSIYFSHLSYVAQVAEMVKVNGKPVLKKIYCAVDCGIVVNQSGARNQIMGGIVDGLGHSMYSQITFKDGASEQSNFNNYRLIRMNEIPEIEVHFIDNGIDPTGLGEPALPPLSGAIANALYKVTGKRFRNQPFFSDNGALLETLL
jgi:isoquinoline 1-oxidoreductase subunit beta